MKDNQTENNAATANGNGKNLSPVYEVMLCKTREYHCSVPVTAWSEEEALRNAVMTAPFYDLPWQQTDGSIRPVTARKISKN